MSYIDVRVEMYGSDAFLKLENLLNKMQDVPPDVIDDINNGMSEMEIVAKGLCPVDTGRLRDSIHVEGDFPTYSLVADAVNDQGEPYSAFLEFGSSKQEAQPFLYPAVDAIMVDLISMIRMHYAMFLQEG